MTVGSAPVSPFELVVVRSLRASTRSVTRWVLAEHGQEPARIARCVLAGDPWAAFSFGAES
jgi:hypothetical protein